MNHRPEVLNIHGECCVEMSDKMFEVLPKQMKEEKRPMGALY